MEPEPEKIIVDSPYQFIFDMHRFPGYVDRFGLEEVIRVAKEAIERAIRAANVVKPQDFNNGLLTINKIHENPCNCGVDSMEAMGISNLLHRPDCPKGKR